jgi:hypothetical protein
MVSKKGAHKMKKIISCFSLLCIGFATMLALTACSDAQNKLEEPSSPISVKNSNEQTQATTKTLDLTSAVEYEVKIVTSAGDNNGSDIHIEYPQFKNMPNKQVEEHLNEYLMRTILPTAGDVFTMIEESSKITLSTLKCISGISQGTSARPGTYVGNGAVGFTYDLQTDRELSIDDVVVIDDAFFDKLKNSADVLLPGDKTATNPQYYIEKYIDIENEQTHGIYQRFFLTATTIYLIFASNIEDGDWFAVGVELATG